ncbi:MAG: sugar ABC transporter ATP-binding protein [Bryobacteraceae bacterium]
MLLDLRAIEKRFGGVRALRRGDLSVEAGQVHLLMGENGAGKSTLMKIVAGLMERDGGEMLWKGQRANFRNPTEASKAGISMVHQESLLAPHLTVAENIFLGREDRLPFGWVNRPKMMRRAAQLIESHGFPLQAGWKVAKLSPAGKQLVEICRAIEHQSSLLIFDEPTSSLSESETHEVFRIVRRMRDSGTGVIYITHRLDELREVGDCVTVLRDGETVHNAPCAELPTDQLIQYMVGREVSTIYARESVPPGDDVLVVKDLSRAPLLKNVSLTLRAGEIVGLAGLIGAGRTELCRAIFGLDTIDRGEIYVRGQLTRISSPREAVRAGIALIPEDRQKTGLATGLSLGQNLTAASMGRICRFGFIDSRAEKTVVNEQMFQLRVKAESANQLAGRLSGGNQQKIVIGKWLARGARVFLFDEPTRGIDVGAKVEVFEVMDRLAREGAAILMVSSELPELLHVPDRVLVMRQGQLVAELAKPVTQQEIMRHAMPAVAMAREQMS